MKKNIVKINESALKGLIAKSVRKALKEGIGDEAVRGLFGKTPDEGMGTFSEIDNALQERGIDAYVSKFFSDEGRVMVMVKSHENDREIKDILSQFGYGECIGQGVDWIQFTKGESAVNESKTDKNMKKNIVKVNENTLKKIVAESVKKILKENIYTQPDEEFYPKDKQISDNVFNALCTLFESLTTQYQYSPDEIAAMIKQHINTFSPEKFVESCEDGDHFGHKEQNPYL